MPQMNPMNWIMLMFYFMSLLMIMSSIIYFNLNFINTKKNKSMNKNNIKYLNIKL
uniref:ATP synthase complex subunit 8 n=1 Tax=Abaria herringbona TaxID=2996732 RepID=A0A9E8LPE4_9NEOP|nr:ATP synthase F0 subunit 8 [Abaria herringbona]UZZ43704.1 ATP synthase F0 subunit 8 [Abaria herringbona]